ncbi:sugar ABC transporter ATP-binding protein [Mesorhizobium australicum]|uniref:sugar ABC transporter ATP-binding protein n=1 Tax=Mesorhizobium australicum TaxID=536018 RepID=UPI00333837A7
MPSLAEANAVVADRAPVIALSAIRKSFGGKVVLENVSFAVHPGECLMLVGENGAGKSTLKNIMCGLLQPDAGSITIDGRALTIGGQRKAQELGIATIHQELSLFPNLSVAENIHLGQVSGPAARIPWKAWRERALRILRDQLESDIEPNTTVEDLSIGQRQLVEIAKALVLDARIVILDEPTTCLTLPERNRLIALVRRLLADGIAVIYITHFMDEVYALADHIAVLRDGRLVGEGKPSEIPRSELGRLMAGREVAESIGTLPPAPVSGPARLRVVNLADGGLVRDVGLSVRPGEIVGLAGLVGSGRSEVAELLVGLHKASSGQIFLDDVAVRPAGPRDALGLGIALISEDRRKDQAFLERPVLENMTAPFLKRMIGSIGLLSSKAEAAMAAKLSKSYRIGHPGNHSPMSSLSGGNQQKVIIGRWLQTNPRLCILDEPTKGIDIGARELIHRLIADLAGKGMAILLISSDLPELMALSHRLVILHKGRTVGEADPSTISPSELIQMASSGSAAGSATQ